MQNIVHTLIPLPALQIVDIIPMDDYSVDLVLEDIFHGSSGSLTQRLSGVAQNQVDFTSDGLCRLGMIA